MRGAPLAAALVALALSPVTAPADSLQPVQAIGMGLGSVIDAFGLPQSMFAFRGSEPDRDDVVFYYPDHMYLFWFKDRVWQVRFDRRSTVSFHGVSMGMSRAEVESAVTERPLVASGDSLYFDLDGEAVPMRVRLAFAGIELTDIYVYRSDY